MNKPWTSIRALTVREEGQTFVEYAMILALIGVLMVGALTFLHDQIASAYTSIANAI